MALHFVLCFTEITVNCPDQTGNLGKPLQLFCNVTCDGCNLQGYVWKNINKRDIKCSDGQNHEITTNKNYTFQCRIPSASEEHNGTITFWVQMNTGIEEMTFRVTIGTFLFCFLIKHILLKYGCSARS